MVKFSLGKQYGKHDCFEVTKEDSEDGRFAFSIRTKINSDDKESKILLAASNDDDRERWIKSIKTFSAYYSDEVSKFFPWTRALIAVE